MWIDDWLTFSFWSFSFSWVCRCNRSTTSGNMSRLSFSLRFFNRFCLKSFFSIIELNSFHWCAMNLFRFFNTLSTYNSVNYWQVRIFARFSIFFGNDSSSVWACGLNLSYWFIISKILFNLNSSLHLVQTFSHPKNQDFCLWLITLLTYSYSMQLSWFYSSGHLLFGWCFLHFLHECFSSEHLLWLSVCLLSQEFSPQCFPEQHSELFYSPLSVPTIAEGRTQSPLWSAYPR